MPAIKTLFLKDSVIFISIDGKEYEVDNPKQCGHWVEGEYETTWETLPLPCEWPGGVELVERMSAGWQPTYNNPDNSGCEQPAEPETVARLLPKEKKEPTPLHDLQTVMSYTEGDYRQFDISEAQEKKKYVESSEPQEKEPTFGQHRKAIEKRAAWLKYCLDIGWTKNQLDGLEKIWDEHHDEFGNLIKTAPAPVESQEELNTILSDLQALENSLLESGFVTFRNAKGDIISIKGMLTHIVRMTTRLTP